MLDQPAGHSAENPLAEPAMAIGTRHDQIGIVLLRQPYQVVSIRFSHVNTNLGPTLGAVLLQISGDAVHSLASLVLLVRCADFGDCHLGRPDEKWQGAQDRQACFFRIFPTQDNPVSP